MPDGSIATLSMSGETYTLDTNILVYALDSLAGPRHVIAKDIVAQCESVFANVRAILEDAGTTWERLVDVTVFLTDMKTDFAAYNQLWAKHFREAQPCRTTVEVNCLPTPIAIELKCIATMPEDTT